MVQYNSHASNQDIVSEINDLCDSDATSYPIAAKTRRVNAALEELVSEIINADGTWQWDDTNHTTVPVGTGNLVEAQESYAFTSEYLDIVSIEILPANSSLYRKIEPLDITELGGIGPDEYFTATGFPEYYDKLGDTIFLYPAPTATAVTLTAGIKVHFKRSIDLFTTSDTTQEPGLPSTHHVLLAYMASIPYCALYKKDRVPFLVNKVTEMKKSLLKFYSSREKDKRKVMTNRQPTFR